MGPRVEEKQYSNDKHQYTVGRRSEFSHAMSAHMGQTKQASQVNLAAKNFVSSQILKELIFNVVSPSKPHILRKYRHIKVACDFNEFVYFSLSNIHQHI